MLTKIRSSLLVASSALLLFLTLGVSAASVDRKPIRIMLDGFPLPFPAAPFATQGTTMVPFRAIAEALNINVVWSEQTQTVTATKSMNGVPTKVVLHKNDKKAIVNGQQKLLSVAPMSKSGSIFVPLSFFSVQFGAVVSWDGASQTVSIISPIEKIHTEAFTLLLRSRNSAMYRNSIPFRSVGLALIVRAI